MIKPSTPPDRWIKVINAPTSKVKTIVLVFQASLKTVTNELSVSNDPLRIFPWSIITHPHQIPMVKDKNTCLVLSAKTMAMHGGMSDQNP